MKTFFRCLAYYIAAIPIIIFAIIYAVFIIPMETLKALKKKVKEDNERRK